MAIIVVGIIIVVLLAVMIHAKVKEEKQAREIRKIVSETRSAAYTLNIEQPKPVWNFNTNFLGNISDDGYLIMNLTDFLYVMTKYGENDEYGYKSRVSAYMYSNRLKIKNLSFEVKTCGPCVDESNNRCLELVGVITSEIPSNCWKEMQAVYYRENRRKVVGDDRIDRTTLCAPVHIGARATITNTSLLQQNQIQNKDFIVTDFLLNSKRDIQFTERSVTEIWEYSITIKAEFAE